MNIKTSKSVIEQLKKVVARVKFLIWVYGYRAKRFITEKFGNARLDFIASQTNKNLMQIGKISNQIEHLHNSIYCLHDNDVSLEERIIKLERKVRLLSKKEITKNVKVVKRTGAGRNSKNSRGQSSTRSRK